MALYAYKGLTADGKLTNGVRDAESPKMVRQLLRKDGVVVTDVAVSQGSKGKGGVPVGGTGLRRDVHIGDLLGGIKKSDIAGFTRQLATLLRAGIPLAESLGALFDQTENVKFKAILGEVKLAVNEGSSFGDALSRHSKHFDELMVSMVRAGEVAGNLDDVLVRLAEFMESSSKLKSKITGAMIYPVIMIVVGTVIMAILMVAVVPEITSIFAQQDKALQWNTELLIWSSHMIGTYWYVWIMLTALCIWGFGAWVRSARGRPIWHHYLLRMPLVGPLVRQIAVARFSRTLATMLSAGVPMLRALDVSKEILGNVVLKKAVEEAREAISQGESIAVTLRRSGHFPSMVTHMIAVGERAGQLEQMLSKIAEAYDSEVDSKLSRLTTMLEPLMLVIMGGAVAFVVFSILMPIMDMGQFTSN